MQHFITFSYESDDDHPAPIESVSDLADHMIEQGRLMLRNADDELKLHTISRIREEVLVA
jgi:hypothetical protein